RAMGSLLPPGAALHGRCPDWWLPFTCRFCRAADFGGLSPYSRRDLRQRASYIAGSGWREMVACFEPACFAHAEIGEAVDQAGDRGTAKYSRERSAAGNWISREPVGDGEELNQVHGRKRPCLHRQTYSLKA